MSDTLNELRLVIVRLRNIQLSAKQLPDICKRSVDSRTSGSSEPRFVSSILHHCALSFFNGRAACLSPGYNLLGLSARDLTLNGQ